MLPLCFITDVLLTSPWFATAISCIKIFMLTKALCLSINKSLKCNSNNKFDLTKFQWENPVGSACHCLFCFPLSSWERNTPVAASSPESPQLSVPAAVQVLPQQGQHCFPQNLWSRFRIHSFTSLQNINTRDTQIPAVLQHVENISIMLSVASIKFWCIHGSTCLPCSPKSHFPWCSISSNLPTQSQVYWVTTRSLPIISLDFRLLLYH